MQTFDRRVAEAVRRNGRRILLGDVDVLVRLSLRRIEGRPHAKDVLLAATGRGGRGHGTGLSRDRGLLLAGRSELAVYNNVDAPLLRLRLRGAIIDEGRGARVARSDGRESHLLLVARPPRVVVEAGAGDGAEPLLRACYLGNFFGDQGAVHVYSGRDVVAARIADVNFKVLPRLDGNEAFGLARARGGPLDHVGLLPRPPAQPLPVPGRRVGVLHFHDFSARLRERSTRSGRPGRPALLRSSQLVLLSAARRGFARCRSVVTAGTGARVLVHAQAHKRCKKAAAQDRASGGKTLGNKQAAELPSSSRTASVRGTFVRLGTHTRNWFDCPRNQESAADSGCGATAGSYVIDPCDMAEHWAVTYQIAGEEAQGLNFVEFTTDTRTLRAKELAAKLPLHPQTPSGTSRWSRTTPETRDRSHQPTNCSGRRSRCVSSWPLSRPRATEATTTTALCPRHRRRLRRKRIGGPRGGSPRA